MARFPVSPNKESELSLRMAQFGIKEDDLEESFIRSSGKGGQHVNKTSTCVQILHKPSGIIIKYQSERSQGLNRYYARKLLVDKIEEIRLGERSRIQQTIEKIRRQKRKRSKRAKDKMLADKKHQSEKKSHRSSPRNMDE